MSEYVLDASALLAVIFQESGADVVAAVFDRAVVSAVNVAETASKMVDRGAQEVDVRNRFQLMALAIEQLDFETAIGTGLLRAETRRLGLSLGDRACLATALRLGAKVLTADRNWRGLKVGVEIEFVR